MLQSVDELYENEHKDIKFIFKFSLTFINFIDKQQRFLSTDQILIIKCNLILLTLVELIKKSSLNESMQPIKPNQLAVTPLKST